MFYASLIKLAIMESPRQKATLSEIYSWIKEKYPYYKATSSGWKNSIRHNLSLNKAFQKVAREKDNPGKGCYWTVDASQEDKVDPGHCPPIKKRRSHTQMKILQNQPRPTINQALLLQHLLSGAVDPSSINCNISTLFQSQMPQVQFESRNGGDVNLRLHSEVGNPEKYGLGMMPTGGGPLLTWVSTNQAAEMAQKPTPRNGGQVSCSNRSLANFLLPGKFWDSSQPQESHHQVEEHHWQQQQQQQRLCNTADAMDLLKMESCSVDMACVSSLMLQDHPSFHSQNFSGRDNNHSNTMQNDGMPTGMAMPDMHLLSSASQAGNFPEKDTVDLPQSASVSTSSSQLLNSFLQKSGHAHPVTLANMVDTGGAFSGEASPADIDLMREFQDSGAISNLFAPLSLAVNDSFNDEEITDTVIQAAGSHEMAGRIDGVKAGGELLEDTFPWDQLGGELNA